MAVKKASEPKEKPKKQDDVLDAGFIDKEKVKDPVSFCVYIGPSIRGVIQNGTIVHGSRADVEKSLASGIEKYPLIAKLIVTDLTLAEDRIKVKTAGNMLNVYYKKLASGNLN